MTLPVAERPAPARPIAGSSPGAGGALVRRRLLDIRVLTASFAYLFAIYSYIQPTGYRSAYPSLDDRLGFARSFATSKGLQLLYGQPHNVATVAGYTAWRVGGILAVAAAMYGLLAGVRLTRGEEESGRLELVLAATVARRTVSSAALAAGVAGALILWAAEFAGFVVGRLAVGGSAYLALATVSVVPVCGAVAALAGELAPTRRVALELAGSIIALFFLLRVIGDTVSGLGWLRWTTPLGWAELLRPFAGPRPLVLLLPLASTLALLAVAVRIASSRDIGTGALPSRDTATPRLWLLSSPTAQAMRSQAGVTMAWAGSMAVFAYILGTVSKSISPADVSQSIQNEISKIGAGQITTPTGYLAFVFIFVQLAISVFVCTQVGAARQEEIDQRLETMLALAVGRRRWLAGRLVLATLSAVSLALIAGFLAWAGVSTGGAHVSLPRILEAGANALPVSFLFLGVAALAYAAVPRMSSTLTYALLVGSFIWELVGSLLGAPRWLLDVTPFAHVGLVPTEPFRAGAAAVMLAVETIACLLGLELFRRRDLIGD
jgi:polyether ionophore transport system permease protein